MTRHQTMPGASPRRPSRAAVEVGLVLRIGAFLIDSAALVLAARFIALWEHDKGKEAITALVVVCLALLYDIYDANLSVTELLRAKRAPAPEGDSEPSRTALFPKTLCCNCCGCGPGAGSIVWDSLLMAAGIVGWRILHDGTKGGEGPWSKDARVLSGVLVGFFVGRMLLIFLDVALLVLSCAGGGRKAAGRRREMQNSKPEGVVELRTPAIAEREAPQSIAVRDDNVQEEVAADASAREHGLDEAPPPYPGPRQELDAAHGIAEVK